MHPGTMGAPDMPQSSLLLCCPLRSLAQRTVSCAAYGVSTIFVQQALATLCAQDMDVDNRMSLYQHIVLSGGSTMLPGLTTRLERDIRALYLQHVLKAGCAASHALHHTAVLAGTLAVCVRKTG